MEGRNLERAGRKERVGGGRKGGGDKGCVWGRGRGGGEESYERLVTLSLTLIANFCKKVSEESTDPLVETRERGLWRRESLAWTDAEPGLPDHPGERVGREGGGEGGREG